MKKGIIVLVLLINSYVAYSQTSWEKSDTILIQAYFYDTETTVETIQDNIFGPNFWDQVIAGEVINIPDDIINLLEPYDFKPVSAEYSPEDKAIIFIFRKIRIESEIRYGENTEQFSSRLN